MPERVKGRLTYFWITFWTPRFLLLVGLILLLRIFFFFVFSEDEKAKREVSSWTLEGDVNTNPWSGYRYTGKLRPHYPLVSNRCHSVLPPPLHSVASNGPVLT